jgi:hypothetical protein
MDAERRPVFVDVHRWERAAETDPELEVHREVVPLV